MSEFLNSDIRNQHSQLDNNNYFEKLNCKKNFFRNPESRGVVFRFRSQERERELHSRSQERERKLSSRS